MVKCYNCESDMIWRHDFNFNEVGYEGDGVVTSFICPACDTYAEFGIPDKNSKYSKYPVVPS